MNSKKLLILALLVFGMVGLLHYFNHWLNMQPWILQLLRYLALAISIAYAWQKKSLTAYILVFMFVGIEVGYDFPEEAKKLKVLSDIFLRLIKTIIAPLLFATLVLGIAGHSNIKQVGRMGLKAILYFEIVTTIALAVGLFAINFSQAGKGAELQAEAAQVEKAEKILSQKHTHDVILDIFPENIAKAVVENQVLQVVVFSILFGIALAMVSNPERKKPMIDFCEGLAETMFKFTNIVMWVAPLAVGGAMAYSVATMGLGLIGNLFKLVGTLYGALILFIVVVLFPIALLVKLPIKRFMLSISEPVSIAFATASSEAALPKAMDVLEKFGIPRHVVAFVLPTGYSFNLDGTTLYLSLASVFVAQACGVDLTVGQQISMCLLLMLTSKGVAGVRGASFLILVSTISSFSYLGLDPTKAFAILAVDALMDMGRTSVNVIGNCLATYVIAKWEKAV
jgi:proton glutamate symport protein